MVAEIKTETPDGRAWLLRIRDVVFTVESLLGNGYQAAITEQYSKIISTVEDKELSKPEVSATCDWLQGKSKRKKHGKNLYIPTLVRVYRSCLYLMNKHIGTVGISVEAPSPTLRADPLNIKKGLAKQLLKDLPFAKGLKSEASALFLQHMLDALEIGCRELKRREAIDESYEEDGAIRISAQIEEEGKEKADVDTRMALAAAFTGFQKLGVMQEGRALNFPENNHCKSQVTLVIKKDSESGKTATG